MEELGGVASRGELIARCPAVLVDLAYYYRAIVPVRRGLYVLPGTDERILRALRVGGRLACVSALAYYRDEPDDGPVHVLVEAGASRLAREGAVVHWTRRAIVGRRAVVAWETAVAQARACDSPKRVAPRTAR